MQLVELFDNYIFSSSSKKEEFNQSPSFTTNILIFLISILSWCCSYSLIHDLNFSTFVLLLLTNSLFIVFALMIFVVWISFCIILLKKEVSILHILFFISNGFSLLFLLLPLSIILYYFKLRWLYSFAETIVFIKLFIQVVQKIKIYFGLSNLQIFFIIMIPIGAIFILFMFFVVFVVLMIYGKI